MWFGLFAELRSSDFVRSEVMNGYFLAAFFWCFLIFASSKQECLEQMFPFAFCRRDVKIYICLRTAYTCVYVNTVCVIAMVPSVGTSIYPPRVV